MNQIGNRVMNEEVTADVTVQGAERVRNSFPKGREKGIKRGQYANVLGLLTDENIRSMLF